MINAPVMINATEGAIRATGLEADDSLCHVSWRARPGSFVSLMTLYESSYIRLGWLISNLEALAVEPSEHVSTVPGDCPLHLRIEDRSRYTTTLTLTHYFDVSDESEAAVSAAILPHPTAVATRIAEPDLQVRVYHDARLAEVKHCARWHRHGIFKALDLNSRRAREALMEPSQDLSDRWLRNMMLNKWLDYCVERGHAF